MKKIWLLHHDNTKSHTVSIVREFLRKGKTEILTHPHPNLAPCDFWVFGALNWELRNTHFKSNVELVTAANHLFQDPPPKKFHKMITVKREERMLTCIANDNGYFEKDNVDRDDDNDDN